MRIRSQSRVYLTWSGFTRPSIIIAHCVCVYLAAQAKKLEKFCFFLLAKFLFCV